jgi:hypothetical protein
LETKASIEKAIGSVAEPFSNGKLANKELVACPTCFRDVLQPPMTDEMVYFTVNNVSCEYSIYKSRERVSFKYILWPFRE